MDAIPRRIRIRLPRTAREEAGFLGLLIGTVAASQFFLGAAGLWLPRLPMTALWVVAGLLVLGATARIEIVKHLRRR